MVRERKEKNLASLLKSTEYRALELLWETVGEPVLLEAKSV